MFHTLRVQLVCFFCYLTVRFLPTVTWQLNTGTFFLFFISSRLGTFFPVKYPIWNSCCHVATDWIFRIGYHTFTYMVRKHVKKDLPFGSMYHAELVTYILVRISTTREVKKIKKVIIVIFNNVMILMLLSNENFFKQTNKII